MQSLTGVVIWNRITKTLLFLKLVHFVLYISRCLVCRKNTWNRIYVCRFTCSNICIDIAWDVMKFFGLVSLDLLFFVIYLNRIVFIPLQVHWYYPAVILFKLNEQYISFKGTFRMKVKTIVYQVLTRSNDQRS